MKSVYNQQKSSCDNNNECRSRRCRECGQQCHCHQPSYLNDLSDSNALRVQELQRQNNQLKSTLIGLELELLNVQQQLYAYPYDGYVQSQQQSASATTIATIKSFICWRIAITTVVSTSNDDET
eukprot:TRINITY_DN1453_c0_g1_i1.p2 TRINITY_DN1453_c0_g1~~TRINITY_DN1453_c0_g1_i1.p2  ORF type:complete len:124 (+),score=33.60 TRINITY_DN1453_c0_g1_i1:227-598(+)